MIDFLLLLLVVVIFLAGVQLGAIYGSIGSLIRRFAGWVDEKTVKKP
jgi:Sec-independent protein translocase protein TatA